MNFIEKKTISTLSSVSVFLAINNLINKTNKKRCNDDCNDLPDTRHRRVL